MFAGRLYIVSFMTVRSKIDRSVLELTRRRKQGLEVRTSAFRPLAHSERLLHNGAESKIHASHRKTAAT